jgi:ankyrin repeat protein
VSETANRKLFAAVSEGDLQAAAAALEQGASLSAVNEVAMTPLTFAAREGRVDMVLYLLDRGAEVTHDTLYVASESVDCPLSLLKLLQLAQMRQVTPETAYCSPADAKLLEAAYKGDLAGLLSAMEADADVGASDGQDTSALRWATRHRHQRVMEALLDGGANVNQASATGWTALMEAVIAGDEGIVASLIGRGAGVNARTSANASVLFLAQDVVSFSADPEQAARIVELLKAQGAEYEAPGWDD